MNRHILVIALSAFVLLAVGCQSSDDAPETGAAEHENHNALPLPKRLAFMTGHVEAGLALYRAGEPKMAAKHLLHPVSETHAAERVGLDKLGFNAALFEVVSKALDTGIPAAEIEPQLKAAQENLAEVAAKAGGDPADIINFLLDTIVEEYSIGVSGTKVTDPGEYQDAFGFTVVAIAHAADLPEPANSDAGYELQILLAAWRGAPVPPESAMSVEEIKERVAAVRRHLSP